MKRKRNVKKCICLLDIGTLLKWVPRGTVDQELKIAQEVFYKNIS